ncbi:hypothetical protein Pcinc_005115 [Petrolisthes cinctipes]|uniref:Uncharacterized protein n=1 Tax=Petrolisthes cinctipes TaxID=88211 RepID=A0AAE1L0F7_PETCI|nr:hypothetical protein Pcinc_005115 [Petrolisthes cinctipes]
MDMVVTMVKTQICHETKQLDLEREIYCTSLDCDKASRYVCNTVLELLAVANQKAKRGVISFLKGVTMGEGCSEFHGFNTRLCPEQGELLHPKTKGSGLAEILEAVLGGVGKMLSGKKFPKNMRALCLLTEELLRVIVNQDDVSSHDDLLTVLEDLATRSRIAKLWIVGLIKPVLIMM